jgi:outer membrane biosynthesis protein TonB
VNRNRWRINPIIATYNGPGLRDRGALLAGGRTIYFAYGDGRDGLSAAFGARIRVTLPSAPPPTPEPTPTPAPTAAPEPTPTPASDQEPTATPKPTATPSPDPTAAPTGTPAPTATPAPDPTEAPDPPPRRRPPPTRPRARARGVVAGLTGSASTRLTGHARRPSDGGGRWDV